ncbi:MAG: response regulator [Candidatus Omnitrophota bacterium]|nr:response regulator [Candidatus Omnitrophota bacterium]
MIKILTVDDEIDICGHIKDVFSRLGYEVLTASSGKDALSILKQERPGIVFLDILMSGMTGLEILRQIKEFDASIKVIMLSIADDPDTRNKARILGADGFLKKPFLDNGLQDEVIRKINELSRDKELARILIVDDEEGLRTSLKSFLSRRFECEVFEAGTGEEALGLLKKDKFDLMLLDIKMPGISGMEVIKEKKKLGYKLCTWVITRFDSDEVAQAAIKEGADDYIPKPFSLKLLDRKIRDFLAGIGKYKPKASADSER